MRRIAAAGMILGFATTVVTAWALALRPVAAPTSWANGVRLDDVLVGHPPAPARFSLQELVRPGVQLLTAWAEPNRPSASEPVLDRVVFERGWAKVVSTFGARRGPIAGVYQPPARPSWFPLPPSEAAPARELAARAVGWPLFCLVSRHTAGSLDHDGSVGALRILPAERYVINPMDPDMGTAPLIPIPLGLLADTAFFTFMWLAIPAAVFGPRRWIRAQRRRRGCCTACGYDLKGVPRRTCPECGTPSQPAPG